MANKTDFRFENHFTLILARPLTRRADAWVAEHIGDDAQFMGDAVVIEPRYAGTIAEGIVNDGLTISGEGF